MALGFIAFSIGNEFRMSQLKQIGKQATIIGIFQAVVNQTISGLACGKPIRGCVAFLGGPLHFMTELKKAFIRTLNLTEDMVVDPENSHLFAAIGAAMSDDGALIEIDNLIQAKVKYHHIVQLFLNMAAH